MTSSAPRPRFAGLLLLLSACGPLDAQVVDVDGRAVEVVEAGSGPATVVFESGLGDGWRPWHRVASDLADDAHVFAYSRPGLGRSDDPTTPRDPAHVVEELRVLLASQDVAPPYVLVGHSNGGGYMELFARLHPDETAGLVLVDGRPGGFLDACEAAGLEMCGIPDAALEREDAVVRDEYRAYAEAAEQLAAAGPLGAFPVRVLTATHKPGASDARSELWSSLQRAIADEAEDGEQIGIDGGHYLQVTHPREVADVVREVLP